MPTQLTIVFLKWILLHCFCISCGTEDAELLIPVSEVETVVCSCFQMAPHSDLLAVKPEGSAWSPVCPGTLCGCTSTRTQPTHAYTQTPLDMLPLSCTHQTPSIKQNPTQSPICARPYQVHCQLPLNYKSQPNQEKRKKKKTVTTPGNGNKFGGIHNGW